MKKLLVTAASMLLCFLAHSQEADELGGGSAELTVVARGEYLHGDPLGNSSLYTLLDGSFSEHFSYSIANHWLSSDPASLYGNTFRSDDVNWLDWAYLTYSSGDFALNFGKMVVLWGTYEMDEYDFDIHYPFASNTWNNLPAYQWGFSLAWQPMEVLTLETGLLTSPYGEHPFTSGMYNLGFRAKAEGDGFGAMLAYNLYNRADAKPIGVLSGGTRYEGEKLSITCDFTNKLFEDEFTSGHSSNVNFNYFGLDGFEFLVNLGEETYSKEAFCTRGGLALHYYPLENLRIHLLGAFNYAELAGEKDKYLTFSVGLSYTFSKGWSKKI
ncbi:MAG: hypothetical protein ACI3ZF_02715 [Candidatus Cryptobacteroides sp.]